MNNLIIYLIIINIISFLTTIIDKKLAIKNKRRISERSLFILAISGGSVGILSGMYLKRHKTKKIKFYIGIPLIIIIQLIIIYYLIRV